VAISSVQPPTPLLVHLAELNGHSDPASLEHELAELCPAALALAAEFNEVARLAAECGRFDLAIAMLEEKHQRGWSSVSDLRALASAYMAIGRLETAVAWLQQARGLAPTDRATIRDLGIVLARLGPARESETLAAREEHALESDPEVEVMTQSNPAGVAVQTGKSGSEPARQWSDAHVHRMLELFRGRPGLHARHWINPAGVSGSAPVKGELTPALVAAHLRGDQTLGVYPLDRESQVRWIVFHVDMKERIVEEALRDRHRWLSTLAEAFQLAGTIADLCAMESVPTTIEFGGFSGYCVWIFLASPLPASQAVRFTGAVRNRLADIPPDVSVAVFPDQIRFSEKNPGRPVKMPLGVHSRSGRRSTFVTDCDTEVADPYDFLFHIRKVEPAKLVSSLRVLDAQPESPASSESNPAGGVNSDMAEDPAEISVGCQTKDPTGDEQLSFLLDCCPVLAALVRKAREKKSLSYEEQMVIVQTVGHLENGVNLVNQVFGQLRTVSHALMLKIRPQGNPASCEKIRSRTESLRKVGNGIQCSCRFGDHPMADAHPLLHLHKYASQRNEEHAVPSKEDPISRAVDRYLSARESWQRTTADFQRAERDLLTLLETENLESVPAGRKVLRRCRQGDGKWQLILETGTSSSAK